MTMTTSGTGKQLHPTLRNSHGCSKATPALWYPYIHTIHTMMTTHTRLHHIGNPFVHILCATPRNNKIILNPGHGSLSSTREKQDQSHLSTLLKHLPPVFPPLISSDPPRLLLFVLYRSTTTTISIVPLNIPVLQKLAQAPINSDRLALSS